MFLEETLERMQNHSNNLFHKQRSLSAQNKPHEHIKKKLRDLNSGIEEVYEKANSAWNTVREEAKELQSNALS